MGCMSRSKLPRPTDAELRILAALWELGPSTVRELHGAIGAEQMGYTTVLKNLQIMTEKGLVRRDTSTRPQVYRATASEQQTQRQLLGGLLDRAFGGSAAKLVQQALNARRLSADEIAEIRSLIDGMEEGEDA